MSTIRRPFFLAPALALLAAVATAATYLPISDADLAGRSPLIVRGRVLSQAVSLQKVAGSDLPFTITTLQVLETLHGAAPGPTLRLRVPGGRIGSLAWWVPGAPSFAPNQEVLLLLRPAQGRAGEYDLSELGLSRFDLQTDQTGRRFALRPAFDPEADLYVSRRAVSVRARTPDSAPTPLRDAESLLASLRSLDASGVMPEVEYAEPKGPLSFSDPAGPTLKPEWVNIGGPEPATTLFRWFWDTGASPNAVVSVVGTQSNLSDFSNGIVHAQTSVDQWRTGVPATDIRVSGITGGGNVTVNMDATSSHDAGATWTTPLPCGTGGVIGLGSTGPSSGPRTFKGDSNYYAPGSGIGATVSMRQRTGVPGCYSAATFRAAVMHELGHTLGLGHPDQNVSTHSTTSSTDWSNAVMHSVVPAGAPSTPQTDDIQAMQYYYGTGAAACVPNATTLCLNNNRFRLTAAWVSSSQSGQGQAATLTTDTGYFWFFNQTNVEMVVKVLNACSLNAKYWVFAGGLTNVQVTLTITDTQTGAVVTKVNPQGTAFLPVQDIGAFSTCP